MVLSMPVLMVVEKFMKKVVPDMLSTVFVPVGTMAVMIPVSLCALAPIGSILGSMVGNFMFGLGNAGGIVTILSLVVIAALWEFLVMTGMHQVLLALVLCSCSPWLRLLRYGRGRYLSVRYVGHGLRCLPAP